MRYFLMSALLLLTWVGCSKKNPLESQTQAIITFTGDYAVDGCGYWISIDEIQYKPTNEEVIPESFKTSSPDTIQLTYIEETSQKDFQCGLDPTTREVEKLKIVEIE